jgi:hypothetical protein
MKKLVWWEPWDVSCEKNDFRNQSSLHHMNVGRSVACVMCYFSVFSLYRVFNLKVAVDTRE